LPYRKDEVWAPAPDIRRIREHIGWQPVIGLQQGLERTVAWYRANRHFYASAPCTTPLS
jgi:nucleoside-diphosphate-sugar epimerase